jgi:hypothetical protein
VAEQPTILSAWENFYVIVGSSGAALTGLQFVVIALLADFRRKSTEREIDAFATPTIVHFVGVLLLSSVLSAPWPSLHGPAVTVGLIGLGGCVYALVVLLRARRQTGYTMVFEDWLWHTGLPVVAYGALLASALLMLRSASLALFIVGGVSLLLLCIGIHNAWDTVTFIFLEEVRATSGDTARADTSASAVTPTPPA